MIPFLGKMKQNADTSYHTNLLKILIQVNLIRIFSGSCFRSILFAERGGFEPPVRFLARMFSKHVVSATHPPLRGI